MKLPKRFSLSTLLLLMFAVAAVFAFLQWRRQQIIADVKWLNDASGRMIVGRGVWVANVQTLPALTVSGVIMPTVSVVNDPLIQDNLFSRVQSSGGVPLCFAKSADGTYRLGGDNEEYGTNQLKSRVAEICGRLHSVGFENVELWQYEDREDGFGRKTIEDVDSIGE